MTRDALDVVIPARGEHAHIAHRLCELLPSTEDIDLRVIVVANGSDSELTIGIAENYVPFFAAKRSRLVIVGQGEGGKAAALNRGDRHARGVPIVYLDADIRLSGSGLSAFSKALRVTEPILAAPQKRLVASSGWISAQFGRIWSELPSVNASPIGAGCYAVNPSGRARWAEFPDLIGDDAYVRSRFIRTEVRLLQDVTAEVRLPRWPELACSVRRWADGNRELGRIPSVEGASSDPGETLLKNSRWLLSRPDLWKHLPGFATVWLSSRLMRSSRLNGGWSPDRPN